MTVEDPETLVSRYIREVLYGEDYDAIDELYDLTFDEPKPTITGGVATTLTELRASYAEFHDRVTVEDVEILTTHAGDGEAIAVWMATTRHHESFGGIQPAGNPQPHQEVTWVDVGPGGISRARHLRDSLETVPPAARAAHTSALSMLETGVVAVDTAGEVVLANPAALEVIGRARDDVLGRPVAEVLTAEIAGLSPGETTELAPATGNRVFEVTASTLQDDRFGTSVGRFLLLYDITGRKRRIQRLQVLNRLLRHNLRNNLEGIIGRAEIVADRVTDAPEGTVEALEDITRIAEDLANLSTKASRIDDGLSRAQSEVVELDLAAISRQLVARGRSSFDDVAIAYDGPETVTVRAAMALQNGLWELVENACTYADPEAPQVDVRVARDGERVTVRIVDNGDGIPAHEHEVIEAGEETALEHGSGLGLWIAKWAVESSNGSISFDESPSGGTAVTVELPGDSTGPD